MLIVYLLGGIVASGSQAQQVYMCLDPDTGRKVFTDKDCPNKTVGRSLELDAANSDSGYTSPAPSSRSSRTGPKIVHVKSTPLLDRTRPRPSSGSFNDQFNAALRAKHGPSGSNDCIDRGTCDGFDEQFDAAAKRKNEASARIRSSLSSTGSGAAKDPVYKRSGEGTNPNFGRSKRTPTVAAGSQEPLGYRFPSKEESLEADLVSKESELQQLENERMFLNSDPMSSDNAEAQRIDSEIRFLESDISALEYEIEQIRSEPKTFALETCGPNSCTDSEGRLYVQSNRGGVTRVSDGATCRVVGARVACN